MNRKLIGKILIGLLVITLSFLGTVYPFIKNSEENSKIKKVDVERKNDVENFIAEQKRKGITYNQNAYFVTEYEDYKLAELMGKYPIDIRPAIRERRKSLSEKMSFEEYKKIASTGSDNADYAIYGNLMWEGD